jgi:hypothetical protein
MGVIVEAKKRPWSGFLAGQLGQHHKPPEVLKTQVFCFWSARGILTASDLLLFSKYKRQHLAYITM